MFIKENNKNNLSNPLLSIIVPVYNVQNYLRGCLTSLSTQTLSKDDYEVILVDDKSTDSSREICREFVNAYANFKLIELLEHTPGGCGTPSNQGINKARGKYLGFLDSDDYCVPDMFEVLLKKALENDCDIVIGGYICKHLESQKNSRMG